MSPLSSISLKGLGDFHHRSVQLVGTLTACTKDSGMWSMDLGPIVCQPWQRNSGQSLPQEQDLCRGTLRDSCKGIGFSQIFIRFWDILRSRFQASDVVLVTTSKDQQKLARIKEATLQEQLQRNSWLFCQVFLVRFLDMMGSRFTSCHVASANTSGILRESEGDRRQRDNCTNDNMLQ